MEGGNKNLRFLGRETDDGKHSRYFLFLFFLLFPVLTSSRKSTLRHHVTNNSRLSCHDAVLIPRILLWLLLNCHKGHLVLFLVIMSHRMNELLLSRVNFKRFSSSLYFPLNVPGNRSAGGSLEWQVREPPKRSSPCRPYLVNYIHQKIGHMCKC